MKILFMGTTVFSNVVLKKLIENDYDIVGVVTQPDRPFGRKRVLKAPVTKELALEHNLKVLQPEKIKEVTDEIKDLAPDCIITCAYGQMIPKEILDIPPLRALNVHASLLPKYRGGAPIHKAIINGDEVTGVTLQFMEVGMDTGDVLYKQEVSIEPDDTFGDVEKKLMDASEIAIDEGLKLYFENKLTPIPQDENEVTFAYTIKREEEFVSFKKDIDSIYNQIRGLIPWPTSYGVLEGLNVKIHGAKKIEKEHNYTHGSIIEMDLEGTHIAVDGGIIILTSIQPAGKPKMKNQDILNGYRQLWEGKVFE